VGGGQDTDKIAGQQHLPKPLSDSYIRKVLAEIYGTRRRAQRLDEVPFHPFPARMPLSIAQYLVECLSASGAVVLDPGSHLLDAEAAHNESYLGGQRTGGTIQSGRHGGTSVGYGWFGQTSSYPVVASLGFRVDQLPYRVSPVTDPELVFP
jgi:hypothetical protein